MKRMSDYFKPAVESHSASKKPKSDKAKETTEDFVESVKPSTSTAATAADPPATTETESAGKHKSEKATARKFQQKWLTDTRFKDWLIYDQDTGCMKCSFCSDTGKSNPFVSGCKNFRTSTLERHMSYVDHIRSLTDKKGQVVFKEKVQSAFDNKRKAVICALRTVYFLCKEKIATVKYGPFLEFLKLQNCPDISGLFSGENATYQSERAAEDFQEAICKVIENDLKDKLSTTNVVSLMCDESDDISVHKKLVCYVRFIPNSSDFEPTTQFLGNISIDKGDAETVYKGLKSVACAMGINMNKVMFFGSDGAAVMTGQKSGVIARLKKDQPSVVNIHCMAHKLALCTSQAADSIPYLKKYKETLTNIFYHFKHSSLRTANLAKIQDILEGKQMKIKEVHSVRWFAFFSALEAIHHSWGSLVTYFEQQKQAEKGGTAKGLHMQLTQFEFVGVTYLLMDIMPILTKVSLSFQKKEIDIAVVKPLVQSTISQLEHLAENDGHHMQEFSSAINDNKIQIMNHAVSAQKNKQIHFSRIRSEFIENIIKQLLRRFPKDDTSVVSALAILGLRGISFLDKDKVSAHGQKEIEVLCEKYGSSEEESPSYIEQDGLKGEWELLKPLVVQQHYPTDNIYLLWKLIHKHHRDIFPNILKLAELALIAPLQTADCERAFSIQNDIKTSDRNRLSAQRLNTLMRISLNATSVADFDYDEAVELWRAVKSRRAFKV